MSSKERMPKDRTYSHTKSITVSTKSGLSFTLMRWRNQRVRDLMQTSVYSLTDHSFWCHKPTNSNMQHTTEVTSEPWDLLTHQANTNNLCLMRYPRPSEPRPCLSTPLKSNLVVLVDGPHIMLLSNPDGGNSIDGRETNLSTTKVRSSSTKSVVTTLPNGLQLVDKSPRDGSLPTLMNSQEIQLRVSSPMAGDGLLRLISTSSLNCHQEDILN